MSNDNRQQTKGILSTVGAQKALPPIPLFAGLPREALAALVSGLEVRRVKAGTLIVREGDVGREMFVLLRGSARVLRDVDGRSKQVDEIRERSFFGEIALFAATPRLATVEAATDAELLVVTRAALDALTRAQPAIGATVKSFFEARLLANVVRANPLFRSLSEPARRAIAAGMRVRTVDAGARVVEQGSRDRVLRLLLRGACEVFHAPEAGEAIRYPALSEGDMFGEISLLLGTEATANVRAATRCVVVTVTREAFEQGLADSGALRAHLEDLRDHRIQNTAAAFAERDLPMDGALLCA